MMRWCDGRGAFVVVKHDNTWMGNSTINEKAKTPMIVALKVSLLVY
jgi:hypothetical protein